MTNSGAAPDIAVAIMARRAELGQGKRRLAQTLGDEATLAVYQHLITRCAAAVAASGLPATVFFTPAPGDGDIWPADRFSYATQPNDPDLGRRLYAASQQLSVKFDGVLLIGTDCPSLTPALLREAAMALGSHDAVLGPSTDGGYYLLGFRQLLPALFLDIPWSTDEVADATRAVLGASRPGARMSFPPSPT